MGTVSPSALVDDAAAQRILETLFVPTVRELTEAGRPFRGLLYGGLMLTPDRGPMVIEWNCRFGDPETQSVLMRFDGDLLPWLAGVAEGRMPAGIPRARPGVAICVVLAAGGYPGKPRSGDAITGLPPSRDDLVVFHAGTRAGADGGVVTAGGRVLGVTAHGADLASARARAYGAIDGIRFDGMHFRRDIGLRGNPPT
jgi:phosphoribosylamine--glycine ligase